MRLEWGCDLSDNVSLNFAELILALAAKTLGEYRKQSVDKAQFLPRNHPCSVITKTPTNSPQKAYAKPKKLIPEAVINKVNIAASR